MTTRATPTSARCLRICGANTARLQAWTRATRLRTFPKLSSWRRAISFFAWRTTTNVLTAPLNRSRIIDLHGKDPAVAGVTGTYALESTQGASIISFKDADSDDVGARTAGFLSYTGPNMLFYSVLRRDLAGRLLAFLNALPMCLSFHDQILCLLYLLNGKFVRLPRLFYAYDYGPWEGVESSQKRDADFYKAAELDLATNKLQWLLCGFEGAVLVMNSDIFSRNCQPRSAR